MTNRAASPSRQMQQSRLSPPENTTRPPNALPLQAASHTLKDNLPTSIDYTPAPHAAPNAAPHAAPHVGPHVGPHAAPYAGPRPTPQKDLLGRHKGQQHNHPHNDRTHPLRVDTTDELAIKSSQCDNFRTEYQLCSQGPFCFDDNMHCCNEQSLNAFCPGKLDVSFLAASPDDSLKHAPHGMHRGLQLKCFTSSEECIMGDSRACSTASKTCEALRNIE